jgi:hypothetical protein
MPARGFGCSMMEEGPWSAAVSSADGGGRAGVDGRRPRGRGGTVFDRCVRAGLYDVGRRICRARLDKGGGH